MTNSTCLGATRFGTPNPCGTAEALDARGEYDPWHPIVMSRSALGGEGRRAMGRRAALGLGLIAVLVGGQETAGAELKLTAEQVTSGPKHHFFGYIGHVGTVPWNKSGRYIVALRTSFQDHMPRPEEEAEIVLIDMKEGYRVTPIERTRGW